MPNQPPKLGPLPRLSPEKVLEQQSFDALRARLPSDRFLIRDERLTDYGVDASLELVHESCPTNIRCLLQLKARRGLSPKTDGSISLSIEASNLNYLLNSPSSVIVLFDADNDVFYWCFAQEEMHRLRLTGISLTTRAPANRERAAGPRARHTASVRPARASGRPRARYRPRGRSQPQAYVTLHFRNSLPMTTDLLFNALLDFGLFERKLRAELLALPSNALLHIDATNNIINPGDAEAIFFTKGWSLADEGDIDEVLRLHSLLPDGLRASPRVQLLVSFTYYSAGRPLDVRANLIGPVLANDLSQEDAEFTELIRINTEFLLGGITREELSNASQALSARASPSFRLHYKVNTILSKLGIRDPVALLQLRMDAAQLLILCIATLGVSHPVTLLAILAERQIAGQLLLYKYINDWIAAQETGTLGQLLRDGESSEATREAADATVKTWLQEVEAIATATRSWPSIHAEARFAAGTLRYSVLHIHFLLDVMREQEHSDDLIAELSCLDDEIGTIVEQMKKRRADDIATRFGVLQLGVSELFKDESEQRSQARQVAAYCKLTGLRKYEAIALTYVSGDTPTSMLLERIAAQHEIGKRDIVISSLSASDRDQLVRDTIVRLRLPPERSDAIRDDIECLATAEEERLTFCRYLHIIQDTRHTLSRETAYARPFDRAARCELLGSESLIRLPDWRSVLTAFKAAHCSGCKHRAPRTRRWHRCFLVDHVGRVQIGLALLERHCHRRLAGRQRLDPGLGARADRRCRGRVIARAGLRRPVHRREVVDERALAGNGSAALATGSIVWTLDCFPLSSTIVCSAWSHTPSAAERKSHRHPGVARPPSDMRCPLAIPGRVGPRR